MSTANLVCRRAHLEDLRKAMSLCVPDQVLYDPDVWRGLPALLDDLVIRELVSLAIIQSVPDGVPRAITGISFIRPGYVAEALTACSTLPNAVMTAALRNRNPFLSPRELGEENARGELHLKNFFGIQDGPNLQNPDSVALHSILHEEHRFFHFGYSYRAMWIEVWPLHQVETLQNLGMRIERSKPLGGNRTATLMRINAEDAERNPHAWFSSYFFPSKPRFHFSAGEQRLLECSLLDFSDAEAAHELHLSEDGIKKRWRSIYVRVNTVDPHLLGGIHSGSAQRKCLLHYLRQHLEELRPYAEHRPALLNAEITAFQHRRVHQPSQLHSANC
jgi:hypothetical protein